MAAAASGNATIVRRVLAMGGVATPVLNAVNADGNSALHIATAAGHAAVADVLRGAGGR